MAGLSPLFPRVARWALLSLGTGLAACSDPPSAVPESPPIVTPGAPPPDGARADAPPSPLPGAPGAAAAAAGDAPATPEQTAAAQRDPDLPAGTDAAVGGVPQGAGDPATAGDEATTAAQVMPVERLLAVAGPVVDAAAPVQAGSWVDGMDPRVLRNDCGVEDADELGDILDAGRMRLAPTAAGFSLTVVPDDEEDEDEAGQDEDGGVELAVHFDGALDCRFVDGTTAAFQCGGQTASLVPPGSTSSLSLALAASGTRPDSRLLTLRLGVSVSCDDCGPTAGPLTVPCTAVLVRGLVYEGPEAGALGPVVEGMAQGARPSPSP